MRIHRQRETFALRLAADNPFDPSDDKKKKYFELDHAPGAKEKNINALPQGDAAAGYNNAQAEGTKGGPVSVTPGSVGRGYGSGYWPGQTGWGGGSGSSAGSNGGSRGPGGTPDGSGILPNARPLYDELQKAFPGSNIGGYRVDNYHEHDHGALDFMTTDPNQAQRVRDMAFARGAPYVLWQQQQWNANGTRSPMENRGSPTQNHMDHVHIAPIGG
jgi:hypothetical protein